MADDHVARAVGLSRFRLPVKLGIGFGLVLVLTGLLGAVALVNVESLRNDADHLAGDQVVSAQLLGAMDAASGQFRVAQLQEILGDDTAARQTERQAMEDEKRDLETALGEYGTMVDGAAEKALFAALEQDWQHYLKIGEEVARLADADRDKEALALVRSEGMAANDKVQQDIAALVDTGTQGAVAAGHAAEATGDSARLWTLVLLAATLILGALIAMLISRSVSGPVGQVLRALRLLTAGDLRARVSYRGTDEIGEISTAVNELAASTAEAMRAAGDSATELTEASRRLTGTASRIAQTAEESAQEAASVSATAAQVSRSVTTMAAGGEQMGASIVEISRTASQAAEVGTTAVTNVQSATATMSTLAESSAQIGDVVKVITAIAEQTNLLALNATIEAARAGEMGKGFAVVASEVKDLAQETARATQTITSQVEAIQRASTNANEMIDAIRDVMEQINSFQTTISAAVEQQTATTSEMNRNITEASAGSTQIAGNIATVAQAAEATSAEVAQAEAAAAGLADMSDRLHSLVGRYTY